MNKKKISISAPKRENKQTYENTTELERKMDEWVGISQQKTSEKKTIEKKQNTYRLSVDIDSDLFKEFKLLCLANDVSIKVKISELILKEVSQTPK